MQKSSEHAQIQIVSPKAFMDIPEVKPGQVFIAPSNNLLLDQSVMPVDNYRNWPSWWKEMGAQEGSLRRCAGTSDYISLGFTVPAWAKMDFRPSPDKTFWESKFDISYPHNFHIQGFSYSQTGKCPVTDVRKLKEANYIKIVSPWVYKTAPGWSCLFLPPLWEPNSNYTLLPSIVNTDYYHHANIVLNILGEQEFSIFEGDPLQHVIPYPRGGEIEYLWGDSKAHEFLDQRGFGTLFHPHNMKGKYKKVQRSIDSSACPYEKDIPDNFLRKIRKLFFNIFKK